MKFVTAIIRYISCTIVLCLSVGDSAIKAGYFTQCCCTLRRTLSGVADVTDLYGAVRNGDVDIV